MRRGLTMIELMLAVSLLAVLMLAVTSWIQVTARAGATTIEPARWRGAAEAVLQLIHDDLVTGSSQGGSMAYLMASQYPFLVKGAVAVIGWLPEELWTHHMAPTAGLL